MSIGATTTSIDAVTLTTTDKEAIKQYDELVRKQLQRFVREMSSSEAHDVHLIEGMVPSFRIGGKLSERRDLDEWGLGIYNCLLKITQTVGNDVIFVPEYELVDGKIQFKKMYKAKTQEGTTVEVGPVKGRIVRQVRRFRENSEGKTVKDTYFEVMDLKRELLGKKMSHDISVTLRDKILRCHFYLSTPELLSCAIRVAPKKVPEFTTLNLPMGMDKVIQSHKGGLILVSGGVGVGKTTTVNSLIQVINRQSSGGGRDKGIIITVEDPVEFIHDDGFYKVIQRQVGVDTPSFSQASSDALRENADIVFLGELRTWEEMNNALQIAETNHLVISTIHSNGVVDTIERFVSSSPPDIQETVRSRLNENLLGIIHQELVPSIKEGKRVPLVSQLIIDNEGERERLRDAKSRNDLNDLFLKEGDDKVFSKALTRGEGYQFLLSAGLIERGIV